MVQREPSLQQGQAAETAPATAAVVANFLILWRTFLSRHKEL